MRQLPGPGTEGRGRPVARLTLLVLLLVLTACTPGGDEVEPSPSPSAPTATGVPSAGNDVTGRPRVAVVIAPDPPLAAATTDVGVRALGRAMAADVEVRVVTADDASFLPDITSFLTTEGYDLVCVVGPGAAAAAAEVARTAPSARFCAAPARRGDLPPNVLAIDVRTHDAAYVVGRGAAARHPDAAIGLLTDRRAWTPERVEAALQKAQADAGATEHVIRAPRLGEDMVADQVDRLVTSGAETLVTLAGVLDRTVLEVARETPLPVEEPSESPTPTGTESPAASEPADDPSPTDVEPEFPTLVGGPEIRPAEDGAELEDEVMAVIEMHAEVAVELAVRRLLEGWSTEPASVGLAEGAVVVNVAATSRGTQMRDLLLEMVQAVTSGEVDVLPPPS